MGILSRFYRLCKADMHGVMDQLEDKGLLLKQYLRDMEDNLEQKEARLAGMDSSMRAFKQALQQKQQDLAKVEADLNLALEKDKDEIARMLIRKRRTIESGLLLVQQRMSSLAEERSQLCETLDHQRLQYDHLKVKVAGFCQQAELGPIEASDLSFRDHPLCNEPTDEEVELELLQRKQSLQRGGPS